MQMSSPRAATRIWAIQSYRAALVLLAGAVCTPLAAESPVIPGRLERGFQGLITAEHVKPHIYFLAGDSLGGRPGGSADQAAQYIRDHFQSHGLAPLFDGSYFQTVPGLQGEGRTAVPMGKNVGALLPGSDPELRDELIVISAHYDHLGTRNGVMYPGADDNASGVSMLLEVAQRLATSKERPRRSIAFVGFDLEERMLWGSRWFAAHPPRPIEQIKFFLTADMIGRSLGNLALPTVFAMGSEHAPQVRAALDQIGQPDGLEVARLGIDLIGSIPRSDYGPFRERKIPFLFLSTGEHPDYHSPRDTAEAVDLEKVARVSSLVLRLTVEIANSDEAPVWTDDLTPNLDEAQALNRIATLLLQSDERQLGGVQRFVVSQAQTQTQAILERGEMKAEERIWLIRLSQAMLLSVF